MTTDAKYFIVVCTTYSTTGAIRSDFALTVNGVAKTANRVFLGGQLVTDYFYLEDLKTGDVISVGNASGGSAFTTVGIKM